MLTVNELEHVERPAGTLILQSMRSHDQFNTTIYGHNDRYRGIKKGRDVVFVNPDDLAELGLADGQHVDIHGVYDDGEDRVLRKFRLVSYPTARGCAAAYYPEANVLVPLNQQPRAATRRSRRRSSCGSRPAWTRPPRARQQPPPGRPRFRHPFPRGNSPEQRKGRGPKGTRPFRKRGLFIYGWPPARSACRGCRRYWARLVQPSSSGPPASPCSQSSMTLFDAACTASWVPLRPLVDAVPAA